ncbi:Slp family lipoprotein [Alteromonas sp. CYL-A6]|uniref:Slp family lipoprotein n=1 Tax=Alteromonas nitratireducens TaxID=3390813 RepID=UPI0034AF9BBC
MKIKACIVGLVTLLSGCAIVPDSIDVPEGTELVSYSKAVTSGNASLGKPVRWGGVIAGVENKPQKTWIEVVHFPLNHYGKPLRSEETIGRFKVVIDGFVDPIAFEEGRLVTFIGTLGNPTAGMVGEQPYMYPTLQAQDYHMWRNQTVYDVSSFQFNYGLGWYSPFYHPYYFHPWGVGPGWGGWGGWGVTRVRVVERGNSPSRVRVSQPRQAPRVSNANQHPKMQKEDRN